ncbi:hypothetical protein BDZ89DRAFT_901853, partial [Hymenopellis radicata]
PRPKPGTSERPPYRAPDPLAANPKAAVTALPDDLTFIHRPPPTAPSPFSLTTNPVSPLLRPATNTGAKLPPKSRPNKEIIPARKPLSEEQIDKIRELRRGNPEMYSRGKLAKMFKVSQNFVGLVASLKSSKRKALLKQRELLHETQRAKWSERHQLVMAIRKKRREFW